MSNYVTTVDGKELNVKGSSGVAKTGMITGIIALGLIGATVLGIHLPMNDSGHSGRGRKSGNNEEDEEEMNLKVQNAILRNDLQNIAKYATKAEVNQAITTSVDIECLRTNEKIYKVDSKHTYTELELKNELNCFEKQTNSRFIDFAEDFARKPVGSYKVCPTKECGFDCDCVEIKQS